MEGGATKNFFKTAFAGRGNEMLGLGLVLGGLLAGLSIYLEQAGPVGDVVDGAAGWTIGIIKLVLPILMVVTGLAMFRERSEFGEITKRLPVGMFLGLVGVSGLLHLSRGRPGISDGVFDLGDAGGILGLAAGGGLRAAIGTWGSVLVLVAITTDTKIKATRTRTEPQVPIAALKPPPAARPKIPPASPRSNTPSLMPGRPRLKCSKPDTPTRPRNIPTGNRLVISPNSERSLNIAKPVTTIKIGRTSFIIPIVHPAAPSTTSPTGPACSR
jgi:S-DNA-T family DNA segregation ATPase FtsK/SpoIIIE